MPDDDSHLHFNGYLSFFSWTTDPALQRMQKTCIYFSTQHAANNPDLFSITQEILNYSLKSSE